MISDKVILEEGFNGAIYDLKYFLKKRLTYSDYEEIVSTIDNLESEFESMKSLVKD